MILSEYTGDIEILYELCEDNIEKMSPRELKIMNLYKNYIFKKTTARMKESKGHMGAILYAIKHRTRKDLPILLRTLNGLEKKDPFTTCIQGYDNLITAKKLYPNYSFKVIGHNFKNSPIVEIDSNEEYLPKIILESLYLISENYDPFWNERNKVLNLRKIRELFPDYKIDYSNRQTNHKKFLCKVEHPSGLFEPKYSRAGNLLAGKDPFLKEIMVLNTLDRIKTHYKDYCFELLPKEKGRGLVCKVYHKDNPSYYKIRLLNTLSACNGTSPMGDNGTGYNKNKRGYFYIHKFVTKDGKEGLLFGITGRPRRRLRAHLKVNMEIETKLYIKYLFGHKDGNVAYECEKYIKNNFPMDIFSNEEISTPTEATYITYENDILKVVEQFGLISVKTDLLKRKELEKTIDIIQSNKDENLLLSLF